MKTQTGVRIEADVWQAYKTLCTREKQHPSRPLEEFLKLAVENDSATRLLKFLREATKSQLDGSQAYARVLLDWYTQGKYWINTSNDTELSVESLLLDALKIVVDADLRRQIEEALITRRRTKTQ